MAIGVGILMVAGMLVLTGCASSKSSKETTTFRVHLEANRDGTDRTKPVPIYRDKPFNINVEGSPFLTEANVSEARVFDTVGGFAITVRFEHSGRLLLEEYSTSNRGKRFAIFATFHSPTDPKQMEARWLAAPLISAPIRDGVLSFTPDCTQSEATELVMGLNRVAKDLGNQEKEK